MKKFTLIEETVELKNLVDYEKGMVTDQDKDRYPRGIKSFESKEEALEELKNYKSEYNKNRKELTEYYIELENGDIEEFSNLDNSTMLELLKGKAVEEFDEEKEDLEEHLEELAEEVLEKFEDFKELKDDLKDEIKEYAKDNGWID